MSQELRKYESPDGSLYLMIDKDESATWAYLINKQFEDIVGDTWLWNGPTPEVGWHPEQKSNPALPPDKGSPADIELQQLSVKWSGIGKHLEAKIYCVNTGCYLATVFYGLKGGESVFCKQNNALANVVS